MSTHTHRNTVSNSPLPAGPDGLRELIGQCLDGKRTAQRRLYDTYSPVIYGIIRRYVRDEHLAQDLLSESFVRIFSRLHQYAFEGAFEGWIRRIAVHAITDHFRKNQKHIEAGRNDPEEVNAQVAGDAVAKLSYKELLRYVQDLPDTQRAVFNLFVFEQFAHKDIGGLLGITENNSRWHLNDARRRLKDKILSMQ